MLRLQAKKCECFRKQFADLFNATPMTGWRVLIDIDGHQVPDPNNGVDGCCWPSPDAVKALIEAQKSISPTLRRFAEI